MSSPTSDQKILAQLSLYSNLVCVGTDPEALLYQEILAALKRHETEIGKWEIVWGPAVETNATPYLPVNSMYVAHNLDQPSRYAVAIAGTNPVSLFDWFIEDFLVALQIPWEFAGGAGSISLGTAIGLSILLRSKPGGNRPSAGLRLFDFLAALPGKDIDLTFTGHSLGGALSPVLALVFHDTRPLWDAHEKAHLHAMATAGPTAGNSRFAAYLDHHLPVTRFWNSLDIVPHAWNQGLLDQLPGLYAPEIPEDLAVDLLVGMAKAAALVGDYQQIRQHALPFAGTVKTSLIDPRKSTLFNYLFQELYQHVTAYLDYFAIEGLEAERVSEAFLNTDAVQAILPRLARRARIPVSRGLRRFAQSPSQPVTPADADALARKVRAELQEFAYHGAMAHAG